MTAVLVAGVLLTVGAALILVAHLGTTWWDRRAARRTPPPARRHRRTTDSQGTHTATGVIRRVDPRMLPDRRNATKAGR